MNYQYSVGNRVLWLDPETQQEVKGTITRLWKTKAEITDRYLEKHKVELEDLELVPIVPKSPPPPTSPSPHLSTDGDRSEFRGQDEAEPQSERTLNDGGCTHSPYLLWRDDHFAMYCWRCHKESVPPVSVLKEKMDSLLSVQLEVGEKMRERGDSERDIAEASFMYEEQIDWIRDRFKGLGDIRGQNEPETLSERTLNEKRSPVSPKKVQAIADNSLPDPWLDQEPKAIKAPKGILPQEKEELEKIAKQRGLHYEWKMIGKHGPYIYVRWRENGQHKSTTLKNYLKSVKTR